MTLLRAPYNPNNPNKACTLCMCVCVCAEGHVYRARPACPPGSGRREAVAHSPFRQGLRLRAD